jgi:hypothetical protein
MDTQINVASQNGTMMEYMDLHDGLNPLHDLLNRLEPLCRRVTRQPTIERDSCRSN